MHDPYLNSLSKRQRLWLFFTLVAAAGIVGMGFWLQPSSGAAVSRTFTVDMTIRQIARPLGVTGKSLARELKLPLSVSKGTPLRELGISQKKLDHVVHHLEGHRPSHLKYYVYVAICLWGLVFLLLLGRPQGLSIKKRKSWYPRWPYLITLGVCVAAAGFALGKSPNPMEGAVKLFKALVGLYPSIAVQAGLFVFFIILAVIGTKLICGWGCPFGALQELIFSIPGPKKIRKKKLPFWLTNTIRGGLFALFLLMLFGFVGGKKGYVIYHAINPFNLFNLDVDYLVTWIVIVGSVLIGFFFYRPFCQFICPFGFVSWFFERVSVFRVRVDHDRCVDCGACVRACPLPAAEGRVKRNRMPADCFSCARCLRVCPEDAIGYRFVFSSSGGVPKANETGRV